MLDIEAAFLRTLFLGAGKQCVADCTAFDGEKDDTLSRRCYRCHASCASCDGPSAADCTACAAATPFYCATGACDNRLIAVPYSTCISESDCGQGWFVNGTTCR